MKPVIQKESFELFNSGILRSFKSTEASPWTSKCGKGVMQCGKKTFSSWVLPHGSSKVRSSHVGAARSWASSESVDHFGQWSKIGLLPSPKPQEMTGLEWGTPLMSITSSRSPVGKEENWHQRSHYLLLLPTPMEKQGKWVFLPFPSELLLQVQNTMWPRCAYSMLGHPFLKFE